MINRIKQRVGGGLSKELLAKFEFSDHAKAAEAARKVAAANVDILLGEPGKDYHPALAELRQLAMGTGLAHELSSKFTFSDQAKATEAANKLAKAGVGILCGEQVGADYHAALAELHALLKEEDKPRVTQFCSGYVTQAVKADRILSTAHFDDLEKETDRLREENERLKRMVKSQQSTIDQLKKRKPGGRK